MGLRPDSPATRNGAPPRAGLDYKTYRGLAAATQCFAYVRNWVEKKVRRHAMGARKRPGFGWKRWSTAWLQETLGLFSDYQVRYLGRA